MVVFVFVLVAAACVGGRVGDCSGSSGVFGGSGDGSNF